MSTNGKRPLRVAHTIGSIAPRHGGPSRTVPGLCNALAEIGVDVSLLAKETCAPEGLSRALRRVVATRAVDVVHDHGLWLPTNHVAAVATRRARLPRIVSPRGMLTSDALRFGSWKKRLAWPLYQRRDLHAADALHVTSLDEAQAVRHMGCRQPIVLIPNGVDVPALAQREPNGKRRRALFLSRIHPIKGILNLVSAWAEVRPKGWELLIAGPDFDGHRAEVEALVRREGLSDVVNIREAIPDEAKWEVFAHSDLFVLPTFSENFGIVVAEALASGVPVITTTSAPWSALVENRCGWWIEPSAGALGTALAEATALTDSERHELGRRGREYVTTAFSWTRIAREMETVYAWMVHGGAPPHTVLAG